MVVCGRGNSRCVEAEAVDHRAVRPASSAAMRTSSTMRATLYSLPPVPCSPTNQPSRAWMSTMPPNAIEGQPRQQLANRNAPDDCGGGGKPLRLHEQRELGDRPEDDAAHGVSHEKDSGRDARNPEGLREGKPGKALGDFGDHSSKSSNGRNSVPRSWGEEPRARAGKPVGKPGRLHTSRPPSPVPAFPCRAYSCFSRAPVPRVTRRIPGRFRRDQIGERSPGPDECRENAGARR